MTDAQWFTIGLSGWNTPAFKEMKLQVDHIDILRDAVRNCGKTEQEIIDYLNENNIPHHFESVVGRTNNSLDSLVVIHLYSENDAFNLRMRFSANVLSPKWRAGFSKKGLASFEAK